MKRLLSLAAVAVLAASACSSSAATQAPTAASKPYISIVSKGFQHQFWQAVKQGAERRGRQGRRDRQFHGPEHRV